MADHVISHHRPRGKRGSAWGHAARALGAIILAAAALLVANWLAPLVNRTDLTKTAPAPIQAAAPPEQPAAAVEAPNLSIGLATPRRPIRRARQAPTGIPLDANAHLASDGFEVLSAAELDAISQARN